jgi:hypothetical protein
VSDLPSERGFPQAEAARQEDRDPVMQAGDTPRKNRQLAGNGEFCGETHLLCRRSVGISGGRKRGFELWNNCCDKAFKLRRKWRATNRPI